MRQKFLYLVVLAVIAMAASWNVSRSMSEEALLSDVALANVEALAEETGGNGGYIKMVLECFNRDGTVKGTYTACYSGGYANCTSTSCK
jgi:hypothetical protein